MRPVPQAPVRPLDPGRLPAFANIFADVQFGLSPDGLAATAGLLEERRKADPSGMLPPIPRLREVYRLASGPRGGSPTPPPAGRSPQALGGPELPDAGDPRERLFDWLIDARQPLLRPQLRQPRLGRLLRRRAGRPGRRLLGRQPAVEPAAARRPGGRLRRPRLRHPPAGAIDPQLAGLPASSEPVRWQPRRPQQLRPRRCRGR